MSDAGGTRRRWSFGPKTALLLVMLLVALDLWAMSATDPDFYLPDTFRPIALGLVAIFVLVGWVSRRRVRAGVRIVAAMTVVALLLLEGYARFSDVAGSRIEATRDGLLRYRYRPGAVVTADRATGATMRINHLGLWDREYTIPKPPDVFRVVVLTGSIANDGAIPFHDRFHEVLERELVGAVPGGHRVEVINASCEGYNTVQQVRLLERVAMQYEPDFVVLAYMLTSASLQNGAYRRLGDSFFSFRFLPLLKSTEQGSMCAVFAPYHDGYSFELIVRNSLERLALLRAAHGFRTLVAVLPVLERFDDPLCNRIYAHVARTARESGHETLPVVDAFHGEDFRRYVKPGARMDLAHPNARGHRRIADAIAAALRPHLAERAP